MYRSIKYLLVELMPPAVKISKIVTLNCTPFGIESVVTADGRLVTIDWLDRMLAEFVGKFDKEGQELYTGDIVELDAAAIADLVATCDMKPDALTPGLYIIGWANGGFNAVNIKEQKGFFLFEEKIVMRSKKAGNQFENQQIVLDYLKPAAEEKMAGTDGEITAAAADKKDDKVV